MQERHTTPLKIDEKMLADYPELAVLTLDLPASDGEPLETEPERMQINLMLDGLAQQWRDRQDFYAAGNMFLYYCAEQVRQIIAENADPARPRRAFRGPDVFIVLDVDGNIRRQKWVVWEESGRCRSRSRAATRRTGPATRRDPLIKPGLLAALSL